MTPQQELQEAVKHCKQELEEFRYVGQYTLFCNALEIVLTALADCQKELDQQNNESGLVMEKLQRERDQANERLAKLGALFEIVPSFSDAQHAKWRPVSYLVLSGPTFLEAIDDLKI